MKAIFLLVAALLFILTACAGFSAFSQADRDSDGRVSRGEADGSEDLATVFESADSDRNGFLDPTEFEVAEQLLAGWKASHGDARDHGGGTDSHSH
jgi:hypothetical protein